MRRLKVLHLIKSLNRGGAETLLVEGLRFADRDRFELSHGYFHPELNALASALVEGGSSVTCFGGHDHFSMIRRTPAIVRHLRTQRIDLLHCHLPSAGVVGRLAGRVAGIPVVYTEHNKPEWYKRSTFLSNAWTYRLQDQVIAVSTSVEESIHRYIRPRVPVSVVRNGINSAHFHPLARDGAVVRKVLGISPEAIVVGNVAALIPQKCLHDWLGASRLVYERCPQVRFLLVGDGPQRAQLLRRIAQHELQQVVHLCGIHSDVRPYLAAMNIFMMSSAYEGLPVALLEAMAMQCAPVCTAVGGITEVIEEGQNGFLTLPGRPDQLANRVVSLIREPIRQRSIANAARRTVEERFRVERMMRDMEAVYLEVLDRRGQRSRVPRYPAVAQVS